MLYRFKEAVKEYVREFRLIIALIIICIIALVINLLGTNVFLPLLIIIVSLFFVAIAGFIIYALYEDKKKADKLYAKAKMLYDTKQELNQRVQAGSDYSAGDE